ncbi:hypothetical protein CF327_g3932 [Tilletia walkeri]|nr:hypothetical protein CF327_g3932 [Tilletia walkeri]
MARSNSRAGGFYAVRVGRCPGVYNSWNECQDMVNGFRGAVFKKFPSYGEAMDFISGAASQHPRTEPRRSGPMKRSASDADMDSRGHSAQAPRLSSASASGSGSPARRRINVYTDGASSGNGRVGAQAGWGVWFEDENLQHLNEARRLPGPTQTNNRAEMTAVWRACLLCPDPMAQLVIHTDSMYCVQAINDWQAGWRRRGWRLANGGPVVNVDLIRRVERAFRARMVRPLLIHVAGHAGVRGNEEADRLAVQGARMPAIHFSEELGELSESDGEVGGSNKRSRR